MKQVMQCYPQVREPLKEKLAIGECEYVVNNTCTTKSKGIVHKESTKVFMVMTYIINKEEIIEMEDLFSLSTKMRGVLIQHERS